MATFLHPSSYCVPWLNVRGAGGWKIFHSAHPFNKQQFVILIQKFNIGFI